MIRYQMVSKSTKEVKQGYVIKSDGEEETSISRTDGVGSTATKEVTFELRLE